MWYLKEKIKEIIEHKNLLVELTIKDLRVQYRKPYFGFFWALIIPLAIAIVYMVIFSYFLEAEIEKYPFFIYMLTALLPWTYFQSSISASTRSILDNKNLINKVSFPKELLPISVVISNLINFLPATIVIFVALGVSGIGYTFLSLLFPLVIILHTICIMGLCLFFSGLQVIYRDIQYAVEVILLTLFFLTPGIYSLNLAAEKTAGSWFELYMANPFVGMLNLYRITLLDDFWQTLPEGVTFFNTFFLPVIFSLIVFIIGFYVFKACEIKFSDYINV